jgi:hypothetical protein
VFISMSQEDPRGKENQKIVPVGFHICSLLSVSGSGSDAPKCEVKEPAKKSDAYYRLYKAAKDRTDYQTGARPEPLPPAIIPGTVISGIDDDGVPQPAYTFKQAVSVRVARLIMVSFTANPTFPRLILQAEATMEPGRYCIIPSMYMRTVSTAVLSSAVYSALRMTDSAHIIGQGQRQDQRREFLDIHIRRQRIVQAGGRRAHCGRRRGKRQQ